jgi:hypothetical protein
MSKIHDWRPNPNPGSDGAIEMGCTCAVLDNGHGKGNGPFWITGGCPVHDPVDKTMKDMLSEANIKKAMAESIQDQKANLINVRSK